MASYKITLSASNWTVTPAALYWDTVSQALYADVDLTEPADNIGIPVRECWRYNGFYQTSGGTGTQYIDDAGNFTPDFFTKLNTISAALTIYIGQTQRSWKVTLSSADGTTAATAAVYKSLTDGLFYPDDLCDQTAITAVNVPKLTGKACRGYFANATSSSSTGAQYIDTAGNFTAAFTSLSITAAKTIYAWWLAPYKITISANSGTGGAAAFYYDSIHGRFHESTDIELPAITSVTLHTRECFRLLGYKATNADTGDARVNPDGTIVSGWAPTAAATIYARWVQVSFKCTINKNSGNEDGTAAVYYSNGTDNPAGWYSDNLVQTPLQRITMHTRSGYANKGVFSATSAGTKYFDRDGTPTAAFLALTITAAKTIYAQWSAVYKMTLNKSSGEGGTDEIFYSSVDAAYFDDVQLSNAVTRVTTPTRECYNFTGYWSAATGGTQYTDANGALLPAVYSLAPTAAKTFYAQWARVSFKLTLDDNGGTGGSGALYCDGTNARYYSDDHLQHQVSAVSVPQLSGYSPLGYYATRSGGSKYINANGTIAAAVAITADTTVYSRWSANVYTLTFNYGEGSGTTHSKQVTFGQAIGTLPTGTRTKWRLEGWYIDADNITATTVWRWPQNKTALANWLPDLGNFGKVTDYFGLQNANLIAISSDSGDNRQRICVAHTGKFESGVGNTSGIWRNPTVTYAVIRNCTINATLGKAWSGTGSTVSGYMLTGLAVQTSVGNFPIVTATGTANEGRDAINLFRVSIPVVGRSKAQNLLNAISGGGKLQSCTASASCTPVVIAENMMPCASDVVEGRIEVNAELIAPSLENAPTAANGFTAIGEPKRQGEQSYQLWSITAQKEL